MSTPAQLTPEFVPVFYVQSTGQLVALGASVGQGQPAVVALTTHNLVKADIGTIQQQQSSSNLTLSIDTTANSGIAWVAGKSFALGSVGSGTVTLAALSGVTITNVGAKAVVQNDTPLLVQMSPTLDTWLVL